jgi:transposase
MQLSFESDYQVLVCLEPVDMRKAIDGLVAEVVEYFELEPQSKTLFVFCNRAKNKLKLLVWHKNGFMLLYKRLDKGRFRLRFQPDGKLAISQEQLSWLLAGLDFQLMNEFNELSYRAYY